MDRISEKYFAREVKYAVECTSPSPTEPKSPRRLLPDTPPNHSASSTRATTPSPTLFVDGAFANEKLSASFSNLYVEERLSDAILTSYQRILVRKSWEKMPKCGPSGLTYMIFREVFEKCPKLESAFPFSLSYTDLGFVKHEKRFIKVFEEAVKNMDHFGTKCGPQLIFHGIHHAHLNLDEFQDHYWDVFAECITECIMRWVGPGRKHKETAKAWIILISAIMEKIRQGYESQMKQRWSVSKNSRSSFLNVAERPVIKSKSMVDLMNSEEETKFF